MKLKNLDFCVIAQILLLSLMIAFYLVLFFPKDSRSKSVIYTKDIPQIFTLTGGAFDLDVAVLITEDTAFALKYVRENLDSTAMSSDFDARGATFGTIDGRSPIIWLPNSNDESVISHEILHATISIMNWANIQLKEDTEEVYAYELGYLTKQFYNLKK